MSASPGRIDHDEARRDHLAGREQEQDIHPPLENDGEHVGGHGFRQERPAEGVEERNAGDAEAGERAGEREQA